MVGKVYLVIGQLEEDPYRPTHVTIVGVADTPELAYKMKKWARNNGAYDEIDIIPLELNKPVVIKDINEGSLSGRTGGLKVRKYP